MLFEVSDLYILHVKLFIKSSVMMNCIHIWILKQFIQRLIEFYSIILDI